MNEDLTSQENLEKYRATDLTNQGRDKNFMTIDSWIQDGNPSGNYDNFGPEMVQEDPPTLNGQPME